MFPAQSLPVDTASRRDSIWRDLDQGAFRKRLDDLAQKNDVPGYPEVHTQKEWKARGGMKHNNGDHVLPFEVEERLANDFAFIAASRKEVQAVSAVALEEFADKHSLIVRLAANGTIREAVSSRIASILITLQKCASKKLSRTSCREKVFDDVIDLSRERIHARIQSKYSKLPKGAKKSNGRLLQREPLGPELQALARQSKSKVLKQDLAALCNTYSRVDDCIRGTDEENELLKSLVQQSHNFCTPKGRTLEETIAFYGLKGKQILEKKHIRQVNKLGRYWGLCEDMAEASRKYGDLFQNIQLQTIPRYETFNAPLPSKGVIPCFVHAEIQLLIYYALNTALDLNSPRVLGVSKSACYLCNLFILNHQRFFITKTHGRLYPLWHVPNLAAYSGTQRTEIRRVLAAIDQEIRNALKQPYKHRAWPMESFVHLAPRFLSSPVASDLGTVLSGAASDVSDVGPSGTETSKAQDSAAKPKHAGIPAIPETAETPGELLPSPPSVQAEEPESPLPAAHGVPSSLVSECSIASREYPIQRQISQTSSLRAMTGRVRLIFEIEAPAQGTVAVAHPSESNKEPTRGISIDVAAIKETDTLHFERLPDDKSIVLNLHHSREHSIQVTLGWI